MQVATEKPNRAEITFPFEELFFSRTDERGIILSGNSVFQRISMYGWNELLRKPHNLIRHPDMPKAVFYVLWDTIKKGEPIGAYVKNRAKDGRYYWVFAIATPVRGGYLSVRLKPSSEFLQIIDAEYNALRRLEIENKLSPAESTALLVARIKELGFSDYGEFMSAALSKEMLARDCQLDRAPNDTLLSFEDLLKEAKNLGEKADGVFAAYKGSEYVPMNLQIHAAQLGSEGATIGVISRNYHDISSEINEKIGQFMESARQVQKTINAGRFLICTAAIQQEVINFFRRESGEAPIDRVLEMSFLEEQRKAYQAKAVEGIEAIMQQAEAFQHDCQNMGMLALGLEVTRIMGKVESSRLSVSKEGLNDLVDDLENFQTTIADNLKDIGNSNRYIRHNMERLQTLVAEGA